MSKVLVLICAVVLLLPIWFMAVGSVQDINGVMRMPPRFWPWQPTLDNYEFLTSAPLLLWARNTLWLVVLTVGVSVSVSCMAGYAFAFFDFRFKKILWMALLLGIMVPRVSLIIPLFVVLKRLGLSGTLFGVMIAGALSPMAVYLARVFFETVPKSISDAARIDGAGDFTILARIMVPISKPIITCLALFAAMGAQVNYVWQNLQLQRPEVLTLLVGLMRKTNDRMHGNVAELMINPIGRKLAMAMLLMAPMLLIYFGASKYFTQSLGGAIKE